MSDKKLDQRQMESAKEIVIPIRPKELYEAYAKAVYDKPVSRYQALAKKVDSFSIHKRMRTGLNAVLTLPLGIIGRNTARAAHTLADGEWKRPSQVIGGGVGAAAAWWFAGKAAFGWLTTSAPGISAVASQAGLLGGVVKIGALITSAVVTGLAVTPAAFMVGTLAAATAGAAVVAVASTLPAALNIKTGLKRTLFRLKGVKNVDFDGPEEEKAISYDSLRARQERKDYSEMSWKIQNLTDEHQKDIFDKLKDKFDAAAAANQVQPVAQPAAVAAPAAPKATP
jgi:hypothetical protein